MRLGRNRYSLVIALTLALMIMISLAGCRTPEDSSGGPTGGELTPQEGGTLVVAYWSDPISFNPDMKVDDAGYGIYPNIFNQLVTSDADFNVIPDLAKDWEVTNEGMTYTFFLREGVTWHDGEPFTSADVMWTLATIIEEGGSASDSLSIIDTIDTPDEHTVVITLKAANAPFMSFLAYYGTYIMPKHIYEGTDWAENPANQDPVGTGAFKFVEWVKGDHITLEANEDYWGEGPYVDRVVYKIIPDASTALQSFLGGEVDINKNRAPLAQIPALQNNSSVTVNVTSTPARYYAAFNLADKDRPMADLKVRKAIALAVDRHRIAERGLQGFGSAAEGFYTPAITWAYNNESVLPDQDLEAAKSLLDEAGYPAQKDGIRFSIVLPYMTGQSYGDMAALIKDDLVAIGIDVELQELEISAWMSTVLSNKDFDLTLLNGTQGPDPDNLRLRIGTGAYVNASSYSNDEVDQLLEQGAILPDPADRATYYKQVQEIMAEELPILPLAEAMSVYVYKSYVHGTPDNEARGQVPDNNYSLVWLEGLDK